MSEETKTSITIPLILHEQIKEKIRDTEFNSVSSYVAYILRQVLSRMENEETEDNKLSERDEEKVKERLRKLGYID